MKQNKPLLEINSLSISFPVEGDIVPVVDNVSFSIYKREVLSIVGESGCGKSQLALALMGLSPKNAILSPGSDFNSLHLSMIFQDPLNALNPVITIGEQIREAIRTAGRKEQKKVFKLLKKVGIQEPEIRYYQYPHEFSGGMRQRVLIAIALARDPDILIADEPTTALDVTIQAQLIRLLKELNQTRDLAVLFITHDLALVKEFAQRVMVMYAGKIVEVARVDRLFNNPKHPYTQALIRLSFPEKDRNGNFPTIPGSVPLPVDYPSGCRFRTRCSLAVESCGIDIPECVDENGHQWACPRVE